MRERYAVLIVLLCAFCLRSQAQYGVNWPTQPATPMATNVQPGSQTLRVSGVNDFLYSYDMNLVEISTPINVPAMPAMGALLGCGDTSVATLTSDTNAAYRAYLALFPDSAPSPKSLSATQSDWAKNVKPSFDKIAPDKAAADAAVAGMSGPTQSACQGQIDVAKPYMDQLTKANADLNGGAHVATASFVAKPCKSEIVTVIEKYRGVPTGQSITVQLDAECNQFTASGGVLFSEIQNRTYSATPSPSGTGNFLSVGGTGRFSPTLTSLFNFNLPVEPFGHSVSATLGDVRLGISTGPVLQLSSSQTTAFGWFAGGSLGFLKYLYITPGVHFGQFADYPFGFKAGQQIPSGFGTLTPVKRWTGRFGFAITIKGWDVSKAVKGGTDQPATTPKKQ